MSSLPVILNTLATSAGVCLGAYVWYRLILPRITKGGAGALSADEVYEEFHRRRTLRGTRPAKATGEDG